MNGSYTTTMAQVTCLWPLRQFLAEKKTALTLQPPYSPDFAHCDFWFCSRSKWGFGVNVLWQRLTKCNVTAGMCAKPMKALQKCVCVCECVVCIYVCVCVCVCACVWGWCMWCACVHVCACAHVCICVCVWCACVCGVHVCTCVCGGGVCVCVCMCVRACVTYQTILHLCYKIQLKADGFLQSASVWTWAQKWRTYFPLWNYSGLSHKSITCAPVHVHRYKYCHTDDIITSFIHSLHWHVQNVTIPCHSQECLPFLSVMYPFLPPFSTN